MKSSLSKANAVPKTNREGRVASSCRVICENFMELPILWCKWRDLFDNFSKYDLYYKPMMMLVMRVGS